MSKIVNFQPQGGFDPSQFSEHQVINTAVNSSSFINFLSVTGKGFLEEALLRMVGVTSSTTMPEIKITIDGNVVLDISGKTGGGTDQGTLGVYPSSDMTYDSGSSGVVIAGAENCVGSAFKLQGTYTNLTFPNSALVSKSSNVTDAIIGIEQPIYFNNSLLVQIKSVATSTSVVAIAKARY